MKITRVDVKNWRILNSPQAGFSTQCAVIIGENGSGKSTIIELILSIFELVYKRLKDSKATSEVDGFYLEYQTTNGDDVEHHVVFESGYHEGSNPSELNILIDGEAYTIKEDGGEKLKRLLPANIIAYYAGDTDRVQKICNHFIEANVDAVRKSGNQYTLVPLKLPIGAPFIYSDIFHMPIALTCLLVSDADSYTLSKLNIKKESANVVVRLKKPHWASKRSDEFWGNTSRLFNEFLGGLIDHAITTKKNDDSIEIVVGAMNLSDFLGEIEIEHKGVFLFQFFDLLYNNELLGDVEVVWSKQDSAQISSRYFSEGEKQVIMTSALIEFWDKAHCLFLLDEPDTFLHPKWQARFLPEVQENLKDSQVIITTHSPLMLSTMTKGAELFVMKDSKLAAYNRSTYGMEAGTIMESAMGAPSRDGRVAKLLGEAESDVSAGRMVEAKQKLAELEKTKVDSYDINRLRSTIERFELLGI